MSLFPIISPVAAIPAAVLQTDNTVDATNRAIYTFTSQSVGSNNPKKVVVIVGVNSGAGGSITGVTVDGDAMTEVVESTVDGQNIVGMWQRNNVTATGAVTIVVTRNSANCGIGVFEVTGAADNANDTGNGNANPGTATIGVLAGGVTIAGMYTAGTSLRTHVWAAGITEKYDEVVETSQSHSGACVDNTSTDASFTITCTPSGASDTEGFVCASWAAA